MDHLNQMQNRKRYLVISRVGDGSLHHEWLQPANYKNFDVCLSYYGDHAGRFANDCDYYFESKGPKWPKLKEIVVALGDRIFEYDAVWFPDDDIATNASNIDRMFRIFHDQGLELAQPALTKDSYFSHDVTVEQPDYAWRYTNFIEIMVPIFSGAALKRCFHTFAKNESGWGLDYVWPQVLGYPHKKIAIIDETPVKHTRPVGSGNLYHITPLDEWYGVTQQHRINVSNHDLSHYDGVPRGKKVMLAILVHQDEHVLQAQLDNIRHFVPDAGVVLYNGGTNNDFAKNLNVPVCPYSRPMKYGNLVSYFWDIMKWFEEANVEYEYLINLDHDVLFVKHGFERFLDDTMKDFDCMGWDMVPSYNRNDSDLSCVQSMWNEWERWRPIFGTDHFIRYLNPVQVYRHEIVRRMLSSVYWPTVERMFADTSVFAIEEMFFVTLVKAIGGRVREYPRDNKWHEAARWWLPNISIEEAYRAIHHPYYYWIHPVKGDNLIRTSRWLLSGGKLPKKKRKGKSKKRKLMSKKKSERKKITVLKKKRKLGRKARKSLKRKVSAFSRVKKARAKKNPLHNKKRRKIRRIKKKRRAA